MKRIITTLLLICGVAGCTGGKDPWAQRAGPRVLAYFPPLYSLAATVAGDDAQVLSLITNVGPHDFEPSSRDVRMLQRADLFLTIGLGLDNAVSKKLAGSSSNKSLKVVALGERLPKDTLVEGTCSCGHKHAPSEKHDDHDHHIEYDPHVWLSLPEAATMAKAIAEELAGLDAAHATGYRSRAAALSERLTQLQTDGRAMLARKTEKAKLISFHGSLSYFSRCFDVTVVDSLEAPGQEPSAKKIAQLVESCQTHGARLIATEPQYSVKGGGKVLLEQLKRKGIEAEFVEIDPLETADAEDLTPDYYERKVRKNVEQLANLLK